MGRWSQRQRTGGGINQPIVITNIVRASNVNLQAHFSQPVNYLAFNNGAFVTVPTGYVSQAIGPVDSTTIGILFGDIVTEETSVTFTDNVANVVSPQTIVLP